jgi:deoxyhypusine synthase
MTMTRTGTNDLTEQQARKDDLLERTVRHVDVTSFDARAIVRAYGDMSFQARNLASAAEIFDKMMADTECGVILTLAGSLCSAGLKDAIALMIESNMIDAVVATGANIVDQDFFEALGFRHYHGAPGKVDDDLLRELGVDRIYDTYIDEDQLRECDMTVAEIAGGLPPRAYSSREFLSAMGAWLEERGVKADRSIVHSAYRHDVPIFCPAFSDCSAGFGLVHHQWHRKEHVTIDSVADFRELTQLKLHLADTGIFMLGGGVPKNFTQDVVVATDIIGTERPMHKYAIQVTVADERDGALSGSTLREACSWGKVDVEHEQMVYGEATLIFPLLVSDAWHRGTWKGRRPMRLGRVLTSD